jgi:hypothetical protein
LEAEAPAEAAAEAPAVATDAAAPVAGKKNEERKCQFTGSHSREIASKGYDPHATQNEDMKTD